MDWNSSTDFVTYIDEKVDGVSSPKLKGYICHFTIYLYNDPERKTYGTGDSQ